MAARSKQTTWCLISGVFHPFEGINLHMNMYIRHLHIYCGIDWLNNVKSYIFVFTAISTGLIKNDNDNARCPNLDIITILNKTFGILTTLVVKIYFMRDMDHFFKGHKINYVSLIP